MKIPGSLKRAKNTNYESPREVGDFFYLETFFSLGIIGKCEVKMNNRRLKLAIIVIVLLISFFLRYGMPSGDHRNDQFPSGNGEVISQEEKEEINLEDNKEEPTYTSMEDVALYIHENGHLPSNFLSKKEAQDLGWIASQGNLWEVAPGMSIGGDIFQNREGLLPEEKGRVYYECDIDYEGGKRGAKRIVYSNDGLIFYTDDHYNSFREISFD